MAEQNPKSENSKSENPKVENLKVKIWRGGDNGHFDLFTIQKRHNQTVLDVVTEIQQRHDPSLSYRFACRVGVCGSCAMMVNGKARWTCRTHIKTLNKNNITNKDTNKDTITLEPLANMPKIKDLVADIAGFLDKWGLAGSNFASDKTRHHKPIAIDPQSTPRIRADDAIECINCGVCHASCDVVKWNPDYLGPAPLNRAWTLLNDERHINKNDTLDTALGAKGCSNCHSQGSCVASCPIGLNPTRSIAGLKRMSLINLSGNKP